MGPEIPQLLILAGQMSLLAAQETITLFMASPQPDPGCSHTLFVIEGGTFFSCNVSALLVV